MGTRKGDHLLAITTGTVTLGTRGSKLAIRQTEIIANLLRDQFPEVEFQTLVIQTTGDRIQDRPLSQFGDKGVFVRAIERALLDGTIDLAVHSLKDVPSDVETPGLTLAAFSSRADPRDALVSRHGEALAALKPGARVGTSSLRRRAQLAALRPDLVTVDIRGNVDTRLRKVREGEYDAIILAVAGLQRLGLEDVISEVLPVELFVPDAGQGIMAVQCRVGSPAEVMAACIDDPASHRSAQAERAVVRALQAGCHSPVGALATQQTDSIRILAVAATEDLTRLERVEVTGAAERASEVGSRGGRRLLELLG